MSLAPARISGRLDCYTVLKGAGKTSDSGVRRLRGRLVVGQIAAAMMLLVSAGLLIQTFLRMQQADVGYETQSLLQADMFLSSSKYRDAARQKAYAEDVLERLRQVPGARHVGLSAYLEIRFEGDSGPLLIDGAEGASAGGSPWRRTYEAISLDWPQAKGLPLLRGRPFAAGDPPGLALVSKTLAEQSWPGLDPVGRSLRLLGLDKEPRLLTVAGVLGDTYSPVRRQSIPALYLPLAEAPQRGMRLWVRTGSDPAALLPAVRRQLQEADPDQAVQNLQTTDQYLASQLMPMRFFLMLFSVFAAVALGLAALGIYGVVAYSVSQRTQEIGIRMALGAQRGDVMKLVAGQGVGLWLKGLGLGLLGAYAVTRLLNSLFHGLTSTDPLTFLWVSVLLGAVALVASVVPARKATRIQPTEALRYD